MRAYPRPSSSTRCTIPCGAEGQDSILSYLLQSNEQHRALWSTPSPLESSNQLRAGCIQQQRDPRRTPALQLSNLCGLCTTLKGGRTGRKRQRRSVPEGAKTPLQRSNIYISIIMQHVQQTEKPMGGRNGKKTRRISQIGKSNMTRRCRIQQRIDGKRTNNIPT